MRGASDLTEGPIIPTLVKLTLPIIAANFIQTAYGLVDMLWVGRLGSDSVAAVGTAVFFIFLASSLFSMVVVGTGVKVAHSMGAGQGDKAKQFIYNGFFMSIILALMYASLCFVFRNQLIGFFDLNNSEVERLATEYLSISMIGIIFVFANTLFTMVLNSMGNSGRPFRVNMIGFVVNMVLDPILIFGVGSFDGWGVQGAAISTLFANFLVTVLFVMHTRHIEVFSRPASIQGKGMFEVLRMGMPITVQRVSFNVVAILMAKIIVDWGAEAIAVQRIGIQIEAISFMTIGGLQGAIAAFIGQNYGAHKHDRINRSYRKALQLTTMFGAAVSLLFIVFPEPIFAVFLNDPSSLAIGVDYLRILGFSQLFMCWELMTVGAFNGIGKTYVPPIFSISLNALRIQMALLFSGPMGFGLNGVWMAIALSSVFKGVVLVAAFLWTLRRRRGAVAQTEGHPVTIGG